jgi:hypothetical protein
MTWTISKRSTVTGLVVGLVVENLTTILLAWQVIALAKKGWTIVKHVRTGVRFLKSRIKPKCPPPKDDWVCLEDDLLFQQR